MNNLAGHISAGLEALGLPHHATGRVANSLSLLIGMAYLKPEIIPLGYTLHGLKPEVSYAIHPYLIFHPIEFLLSYNALIDPSGTMAQAATIGLREALIPSAYRPAFRTFIKALFEEAQQIRELHAAEMTGGNKIRYALLTRFRELFRVLDAEVFAGETLEEMLESARNNVEEIYRQKAKDETGEERITPVFHPDRRTRADLRRERTLIDQLKALGRTEKLVLSALGLADRITPDDEDQQLRAPSPAKIQKASRLIGGKALQSQSWHYPCAVSPVRQLGRASASLVLSVVVKMETDEDVLLALIFFGFVAPSHLARCKIQSERDGNGHLRYIVSTKTQTLPRPPASLNLYRNSSKTLKRPIPAILAKKIWQLRSKKNNARFWDARRRLNARLKEICPTASVAKMLQCLTFQGEAWWDLPQVFVETAYRPNQDKVPATRSYTQITPQMMARIIPYQQAITSDYSPGTLDWGSCGSALCPKDEVVRSLFKVWRRYLRPLRTRSTERLVHHWNIVAAGMHTACLLILGLRNHPMDGLPADLGLGITDWGMLRQKGEPFAYYVPPFLQKYLSQVREIWRTVEAKLIHKGVEIIGDRSEAFAFFYLDFRKTRDGRISVIFRSSSHRRIVEGMLSSAPLAAYAKLERKWTRHFSNTVLREARFRELQVRLIHGHHEAMLHAFRRHRLELLIPRSTLLPLQEHLGKLTGLI